MRKGRWSLHGDMALGYFFLADPRPPGLCVAVGIPGGGWVAGISNGCGKVRAGGRWAGAFHARSASTAWVGATSDLTQELQSFAP